ncbi:SWITCH/sucrose nonfermenting 3C [Wolffia australiana]
MSPAAPPSLGAGDSALQWKKFKGESSLAGAPKKQNRPDDESGAADDGDDDVKENEDLRTNPHDEVVSRAARRISDFPRVIRHVVNRPHPAVLAIVSAERANSGLPFQLENISHGQFQALSAVLPDHPSVIAEPEKPSSFVCSPPPLMQAKGVSKPFEGRALVVPVHSDWFNPTAVHRIERPVVPHFFSGKTIEHTPESYMRLRNMIVAMYLENPGRRLTLTDCQGLGNIGELNDLGRVLRFLDHWGIINYLAPADHRELATAEPVIREAAGGELNVDVSALRTIESLVQFDRPRSSSVSSAFDDQLNLDRMIRERLSDHDCSFCSRPLTQMHYPSLKEVDVSLCSDCYHDGRFVAGHSSLSFGRAESLTDSSCDMNGESWSDQETLLLLEGVEKFKDNWNEIADHVGTKSKAQCLLHFLRLPVEDDLLENINVPGCDRENGFSREDGDRGAQLPFANSGNPLMSLVAFLAAAVGPRVGAACAGAALSVLTKETTSNRFRGDDSNPARNQDDAAEGDQSVGDAAASSAVPLDKVKAAAMAGLSAAAMKAKLFADQEEREIQRLAAGIVHQQLKRLEMKLKQFAEVEALLMKECEQAERTKQHLAAERVRLTMPIASPAVGQAGGAAFYGGTPANLPQISSFLARQQQSSSAHYPLL